MLGSSSRPGEKRWALITGASSGIGRALALRFASAGYNVLGVARDKERLGALGAQCRQRHGVEARALPLDLSLAGAGDQLSEYLSRSGIEVGALVNNAGFGVHGFFPETGLAQELDLVRLSISNVVELTKAVLPGMIARQTGGILNVGSVYCFAPVPHQAVYAATKAFLLSFSQALSYELKGTGVNVTLLAPGITRTEFRRRAGIEQSGRLKGADPAAVAEAGYKAFAAGRFLVVPGGTNRAFALLAGHAPMSWKASLVAAVNRSRGLHRAPTA